MAVSSRVINDILQEYSERLQYAIYNANLSEHTGTTLLDSVQSEYDQFFTTSMDMFTQQHTTETQLRRMGEEMMKKADNAIAEVVKKQNKDFISLSSAYNSRAAADSPAWNNLISYGAREIDRITRVYSEPISNMPDMLKRRLDSDLSKVLDSIYASYEKDPSPHNAQTTFAHVRQSLNLVEKQLEVAVEASLKASLENVSERKMVELQDMELALLSSESSLSTDQINAYRALVVEIKNRISALKTNPNIYDKEVRRQELDIITRKLKVLNKIRAGATSGPAAISGYFGNLAARPHAKTHGLQQIGAGPYSQNRNFRTKPPGFRGYTGNGGGGHPLVD